jgi:uncharacterized protein YidB (DUF937 family)
MAARKREKLMPDLEEVRQEAKDKKQWLGEFSAGCQSGGKLGIDYGKLKKLPERQLESWLVLKYGLDTVYKFLSCHRSIPNAITEAQRLEVLSSHVGLDKEEVKSLLELIEDVSGIQDALTPLEGTCKREVV